MIYDRERRSVGDGEWHCPFPRWWVEQMKRAAKVCKNLSEADVAGALNQEVDYYYIPPGDFLSEEQDARGLPLSYCREEERRHRNHPTCCTAIYDYDSVPDMVISNGHDDWPLRMWEPVLTA